MDRSFGSLAGGVALSERSGALERRGQVRNQGHLSGFQEVKPTRSVQYTIWEDRCGTQENVTTNILARLGRPHGNLEHDYVQPSPEALPYRADKIDQQKHRVLPPRLPR